MALPLSWSLPWSRLSAQLQKSGCALAGWGGAAAISRRRTMVLTDLDLFPPGTVQLNGIKVYGEKVPHAVSYAASLIRASGSGLERLFDGLLRSEGGSYRELSDFSFYEEGGCSAVIRGESVLLGTAPFLRKMDVRLPGNLNLQTGLYLAVDRQLMAVFAVKYDPSENVGWALRMLRRSHITPILAARDPNITPALLRRKFGRAVKVEHPPLAARLALSELEQGKGRPRALLLREGLLPYAETVAGAHRLRRSVSACTRLSLLGSHQCENAAVVLEIIDCLLAKGYNIKKSAVYEGLRNVHWPGRFEVISQDPLFILDGAHNPNGINALSRNLREYFPGKKFVFLVGILRDKDYHEMLLKMMPEAAGVVTIAPDNPRAMSAHECADAIRACDFEGEILESTDIGHAVSAAIRLAEEKNTGVCAFGSLYSVGHIKAVLEKEEVNG